ncbi:MAG: hypothetical protein IJN52_02980 [Bacteroidales bacterium]|nr:hypothetical protein [Bacteroidales bacterium]
MDPIGASVSILRIALMLAFKNNTLERIRDQRADLAQDIKDIRQTFRPDKAPDSPQQKTQGLKLH